MTPCVAGLSAGIGFDTRAAEPARLHPSRRCHQLLHGRPPGAPSLEPENEPHPGRSFAELRALSIHLPHNE